MKNTLLKILFSCSVLMTLFAFQEKNITSNLEGTTWELIKFDTPTINLAFNKVSKLNKEVVGYQFKKNNNLKVTQVRGGGWGTIIDSKITSGYWRTLDSKTIQITYKSFMDKKLNKRSNIILVRKFQIIELSEKKMVLREIE